MNLIERIYCSYCERDFNNNLPPTREHVYPVSKGSSRKIENIVRTCYPCNQIKADKLPDEFILLLKEAISKKQSLRGLNSSLLRKILKNFIIISEKGKDFYFQYKGEPDRNIPKYQKNKNFISVSIKKKYFEDSMVNEIPKVKRKSYLLEDNWYKNWLKQYNEQPTPNFHY